MPFKKLFRKYRNLLTPALRDDHFYHSMLRERGARLNFRNNCAYFMCAWSSPRSGANAVLHHNGRAHSADAICEAG